MKGKRLKAALYAPEEYWRLTRCDREALTNGCGTKGLVGILVPDSLLGLDISAACDIHDYMYFAGYGIAGKETADRTFLNNVLRIIAVESTAGTLVITIRRWLAMRYYKAVRDFGGPAFWEDKNKPQEMGRRLR